MLFVPPREKCCNLKKKLGSEIKKQVFLIVSVECFGHCSVSMLLSESAGFLCFASATSLWPQEGSRASLEGSRSGKEREGREGDGAKKPRFFSLRSDGFCRRKRGEKKKVKKVLLQTQERKKS